MKVVKLVAAAAFIAIGVATGGIAFLPGTALAFTVDLDRPAQQPLDLDFPLSNRASALVELQSFG